MQLSTESALLTAAGRIRRVASIEGLVSLAMVLTVYLWPSSDHGGPDNLVIIIWIAVAAGLGLAGVRLARGAGRIAACSALVLLLPVYILVIDGLIDRLFVHPGVYHFKDSFL